MGYVELRDHDTRDRVAYLSATASAAFVGSGLIVEAIVLAIDEAFADLDLVKVGFVLSESSMAAIGADRLGELLAIEGVLRSHTHLDGRRQDVTIAAIHRAAFSELVQSTSWLAALSETPWRSVTLSAASPAAPDATDIMTLDRLGDLLGVATGGLTLDAPLRVEQLDSLTRIELVAEIEASRGHAIAPELLASITTAGEYLGWFEP